MTGTGLFANDGLLVSVWEQGPSDEKMLPLDWPADGSTEYFLDEWLTWASGPGRYKKSS